MLATQDLTRVIGAEAFSETGEKIGKVGQVYVDDETSEPAWATVQTGLFGMKESFVPLQRASYDGDHLTVPYGKDEVKDAPSIDPDGHIEREEETALYRHYGLEPGTTDTRATTGTAGTTESSGAPDDAMTVSEEHLTACTTQETTGKARLRKYVTTEDVTETVPVRKERAVLETEPVTEENVDRATDGPAFTEREHEVTLHEERPVVAKEETPVERVRLRTESETGEETVTGQVRKEHVDVEGDVDPRR